MRNLLFRSRGIVLGSATLVAVTTIACSDASSPAEPGVATAAIEGGEVDPNDPAIGLIVYADGNSCTGTLIAPNVVLTAGHCVAQPLQGFYTQGGTSTLLPGMTRHTIAAKVAHPKYKRFDGCPGTTPDVALVRLTSPIKGTAPLRFATSGTALPTQGDTVDAIGFGMHHDDGGALSQELLKRHATGTFLDAPPVSIHVARGTGIVNHGDSGGPLLFHGVIFGTASCITTDYPLPYEAYYGRVDAAAAWISSTLRSWGVH